MSWRGWAGDHFPTGRFDNLTRRWGDETTFDGQGVIKAGNADDFHHPAAERRRGHEPLGVK